ncbi:MAG: hypothetical protein JW839_19765 [Candidatus Lokiarchaeota archaeon]|nr:hypothetical protein [Candidatus Lokiarchaeota archaeon]
MIVAGCDTMTTTSQEIRGGFAGLATILDSVRERWNVVGPIKIVLGESQAVNLHIPCSNVDLGDGIAPIAGVFVNLEIDVSATSFLDNPTNEFFVVGLGGSVSQDSPIRINARRTNDVGVRRAVAFLNRLVLSGIDVVKIEPHAATVYPKQMNNFLIKITFATGASILLQIGSEIVYVGKMGMRNDWMMMPTSEQLDSYRSRSNLKQFFTSYKDGAINENVDRVRFDEWLIHHLLGIDYYRPSTHPDVSHPMYMPGNIPDPSAPQQYYDTLAQALAIIGVSVDENNRPLVTPENLLKIERWWLLYTSQAGNRLKDQSGADVSLKGWIATWVESHPTEALQMGIYETPELIRSESFVLGSFLQRLSNAGYLAHIFDLLKEFGTNQDVGGGFMTMS